MRAWDPAAPNQQVAAAPAVPRLKGCCEPKRSGQAGSPRPDLHDGDATSGVLFGRHVPEWELSMLWTILVILVVLWLLGLVANIAGGFIHLLLVLAVIVLVVQLIQGRRSV